MKNTYGLVADTAACLALLMGSGCLTTSSYHTARPVAPGTTEMGVAVEMQGSFAEEADGILVTHPRVNVRRGLIPHADLGLSAGSHGTGLDFNYMLVDLDIMAFSINPSVGLQWQGIYGRDDSGPFGTDTSTNTNQTIWTPMLGLLADFAPAEILTITFGIKPGFVRFTESQGGSSNSESYNFLATSLGARISFSDFHLFPEFNLIKVFDDDIEDMSWTFGMGLGF
ncbi:MAG: hypothetical protein ACNA8W_14120 [Bradymonadaceae bacterium]